MLRTIKRIFRFSEARLTTVITQALVEGAWNLWLKDAARLAQKHEAARANAAKRARYRRTMRGRKVKTWLRD